MREKYIINREQTWKMTTVGETLKKVRFVYI
jgi:hypothetical protein